MEHEFFASCLAGLEQLLADELKELGARRVRPLGGGVAFFCDAQTAMRACLWSRLASRVMLVMGRVNAGDADLLYAGVYDMAWETALADDATMAVRAHGTNEQLRNTRFTALKVKDAVSDRLRATRGVRLDVDAVAPRAAIDVRVRDNRATISLDFSGEALNRRPYLGSEDAEDASLSCSLAAAALALTDWKTLVQTDARTAFVDPACRDGITLVEAAQIACDCAPGLQRARWGFFGWAQFDQAQWNEIKADADRRFEEGLAKLIGDHDVTAPPDANQVRFLGASTSSPVISKARGYARRAGMRGIVSVERGDAAGMADLFKEHRAVQKARTMLVACNIDASSRMDAPAHVQADEAAFVAACALAPATSKFVVVGAQDVQTRFGCAPMVQQGIGRGRVQTSAEVYDTAPAGVKTIEIPDMAGGAPHTVEVVEEASAQFAARLRKVFKERRKWAARECISCYRIYDADLPDYAVAIDLYTGAADARGNDYLHIAEYAPPSSVDAGKARRRFADVLTIAPVVCGIRPDHVFSKTRVREKGGGQYRNAGNRSYVTTIEEGGFRFEVDLAGRLDTGIFLDHRLTRELVGKLVREAVERKRASGKGARTDSAGREGVSFLNLFAYTGSASVYAAGAGAATTVTVDLSQTYLDWAKRNMEANGFSGAAHIYERADVMRWITETRHTSRRFDLAFVDPPTFSNSKAMGKRTWDVQRDHVELLIGVSRILAPGGLAVFSCNLRSFKPNVDELAKYGVEIEDISASTIPEDFARNPRIHKCYLVRRS